VVVDYIGLAEEVQKAVQDPTPGAKDGKGGGFVTDISLLGVSGLVHRSRRPPGQRG
jgi:hypothetical protein